MNTPMPTQISTQDVQDLLDDVRSKPGKRAAVNHLAEHYSHLSRSFIERHLEHLTTIDPIQLIQAIGYPDPTGEKAARRVDGYYDVEEVAA